tara:strand:- start:99 stop:629 length:531 start_codon:yes stop_codon:yes gene_type:complete
MDRLLRNLVIFISVMTILILLLAISLLQYGPSLGIMGSIAISLLAIPIGIAAAFSLRSRGSPGPWLGSIFLLMCGFSLIVSGMAMFSEGQTLQGALYFLLGISTFRRFPTLRSEAFLRWYSGSVNIPNTGGMLNEGEVLASCPECHSILAVMPRELNIGDRCPNCSGFLVKGPLEQ